MIPFDDDDSASGYTPDEVERLVDAAVCLCAAKIESSPGRSARWKAVLTALSRSVEEPYDAGCLEIAATQALSVIASLSGRGGEAAAAVAATLGPPPGLVPSLI